MAAGNDDKLNDLASVQLDALKKLEFVPHSVNQQHRAS
jgi:hypothetical protein